MDDSALVARRHVGVAADGFRYASTTAKSVLSGHISKHLLNLPDEPESGGDGGGGEEILTCLALSLNAVDPVKSPQHLQPAYQKEWAAGDFEEEA
ncbi:uncharacterized protein ACA1_109700 [Acanthamoeba castellanii str. Neff]|uniref:Uncharacterized protein n=1 Tax=Acanthamoeba castellanii (strain ATCC 30010 / Neff) TaxID=1257118 RepID=L8HHC2_ACACF|nr:uncharacterized protein ACA1_109700 [Acanthamoeba castellanii str. Neff]ELR24989.1 hypothetical protein ACA1_109700 [Acanthamoeba castellanii str. Neff]